MIFAVAINVRNSGNQRKTKQYPCYLRELIGYGNDDFRNQDRTDRQVTLRLEINEVENFKMFLTFLDYQHQGLTRRIFQEIQQGNYPSVEVKITAIDGIFNLDEI